MGSSASVVPATEAGFVSKVALMDVSEAGLYSFYEREAGYHIRSCAYVERGRDGRVCGAGTAYLVDVVEQLMVG